MASLSTEQLAQQWLELDKDESTRSEIQALIDSNDKDELEKRLGSRLTFGTAGLRARMAAGYSRLNSLTIIQASQGLVTYVKEFYPEAATAGAVIGHDHRHNSEKFAKLTAAVFVSAGVKVHFLDGLVHTPLVPFGIKHLGAVCGVMITASHNPAQDNGYKVYWGNASQIIPPHDSSIAERINQNLIPWSNSWNQSVVDTSASVDHPVDKVREAYLVEIVKLVDNPPSGAEDSPGFVYTAMHGVGLNIVTETVEALGLLQHMVVVDQQAKPDPDFPTVKFPNPEEKGALDIAMKIADEKNIDMVVANDPDADRFALAEKVDGKWNILSGNQVGVLFASYIWDTYGKSSQKKRPAMLCTAVSTQMLRAMAEAEGFHFEETLTGFKWLGNKAQLLNSESEFDALYAFEEAIGYMFTSVVPDKDGVAALAMFLTMLRNNIKPTARLQELYEKYGFFEAWNSYVVSPDPASTTRLFEEIRGLGYGEPYPLTLGTRKITYWRDLTRGYDSREADNIPRLPIDKSSQMITCELEDNVRFTVRGSGTEPKIKKCCNPSRETAAEIAKNVYNDVVNEWFPSLKS